MTSVKIEILKEFGEKQYVGKISKMNINSAKELEKEGYIKIIKDNKKNLNIEKFINPKNTGGNPLKQIVDRMKENKEKTYIEVFAGDDKKKLDQTYSTIFEVHDTPLEKIQNEIETYNISSYGVFFNYNPLNLPRRLKKNVFKLHYIFVDLDDGATEEHNELIKETLKKYEITYSYNAKSGRGYHFLIPINSLPEDIKLVRGFLTYLKENICDKVDVATHSNERLFRAPGSYHNKDDESKQLMTLHNHFPVKEEIQSNTKKFKKHQQEQKKGVKDTTYLKSIAVQDSFFTEILNDKSKWVDYFNMLNKHDKVNEGKGGNQIFNKNLAIFASQNNCNYELCKSFINSWNNQYVTLIRFEHYYNKVTTQILEKKDRNQENKVSYYELLKWANKYKLELFVPLLERQTSCSFLDNYELYYLEDEKKENAYLMYYPEKNYYVQKSFNEVLQNIYFDSKEQGIDLVKELDLHLLDEWEEWSFKKQNMIILNTLHKKLDNENRIKLVYNINYEPTDTKFVYYNKKKFFNTYNKTRLWEYDKKQKNYGFPNIKKLIMNLVGEDEKSYIYFNNWLGWIIQNPTEKLPTALILQGRQGSGKGTFKNLILDNIFGENCQEINQTHLESSFNEYLLGKQIIVANEVMHNENRQTLPNVLKNLVTDEKITISRKFRKEIVGRNFTHWIFCTNSDNPIRIEEDDRRYSVFYSEKLNGGGKKAAEFVQALRKNLDFELKEYISYLKSLKINYSDVHEPISTAAKEEIIELNKDTITKFLEDLKRYNDLEDMFLKIFGNIKVANFIGDSNLFLDTDSFYKAYVEWCNKSHYKGVFQKQNFSKKLSQIGLSSFPRKIKEHEESNKWISVRVYDTNLIEKFMEVN